MTSKKLLGNVSLLLGALIWGSTFVAQSVAADSLGPLTFLASRSLLGFLFLIPVAYIMDGIKKKNNTYQKITVKEKKLLLIGGICCGAALTLASALQQFGMTDSNSGKAGFITAMYILLVPVLGIFLKKKITPVVWGCVALGIIGLYLLCMKEGLKLETSDICLILCAVVFSFHILIVDYFSPKVDGVRLSCIQFFIVFVVSCILAFIFETPSLDTIKAAWFPIFYAGVMSSGIAYTLQIVGQKYTEPTIASLLMSLESVFAVLTGMVVLHQFPTSREWAGCAIMFAAIIISQLPIGKKRKVL